jgi:hypothetical protein
MHWFNSLEPPGGFPGKSELTALATDSSFHIPYSLPSPQNIVELPADPFGTPHRRASLAFWRDINRQAHLIRSIPLLSSFRAGRAGFTAGLEGSPWRDGLVPACNISNT